MRIPPLRERVDRLDVARALVRTCSAQQRMPQPPELTPSAEAWILDHGWPGNVRELKTAIVHALAMSGGGALSAEHFPEPLVDRSIHDGDRRDAPSRRQALRVMAQDALTRAGGNMSEAARILGVARSTLYRMLDSLR